MVDRCLYFWHYSLSFCCFNSLNSYHIPFISTTPPCNTWWTSNCRGGTRSFPIVLLCLLADYTVVRKTCFFLFCIIFAYYLIAFANKVTVYANKARTLIRFFRRFMERVIIKFRVITGVSPMWFSPIFDRFVEKSPVTVIVRALMEVVLAEPKLEGVGSGQNNY